MSLASDYNLAFEDHRQYNNYFYNGVSDYDGDEDDDVTGDVAVNNGGEGGDSGEIRDGDGAEVGDDGNGNYELCSYD